MQQLEAKFALKGRRDARSAAVAGAAVIAADRLLRRLSKRRPRVRAPPVVLTAAPWQQATLALLRFAVACDGRRRLHAIRANGSWRPGSAFAPAILLRQVETRLCPCATAAKHRRGESCGSSDGVHSLDMQPSKAKHQPAESSCSAAAAVAAVRAVLSVESEAIWWMPNGVWCLAS